MSTYYQYTGSYPKTMDRMVELLEENIDYVLWGASRWYKSKQKDLSKAQLTWVMAAFIEDADEWVVLSKLHHDDLAMFLMADFNKAPVMADIYRRRLFETIKEEYGDTLKDMFFEAKNHLIEEGLSRQWSAKDHAVCDQAAIASGHDIR